MNIALNEKVFQLLKNHFEETVISQGEQIQSLWSGYGEIRRWKIGVKETPIVVKLISKKPSSDHPRGWNTNFSHQRKLKSYHIEQQWYTHWSKQCTDACKVPNCLGTLKQEEFDLILLEDIDFAGYPIRPNTLPIAAVKKVIEWLAHFHGTFMGKTPLALWEEGSYWHLQTRPEEFQQMEEGPLKQYAIKLDESLNNTLYRTIIHGDAKLANFCFSSSLDQIAAVDFQYVGGGCGMRDLTYFMGSCLDASQCFEHEEDLLQHYFFYLKKALKQHKSTIDLFALEEEWRMQYAVAWADFTRFLMGWMPSHQKLNAYSQEMVKRAIAVLQS